MHRVYRIAKWDGSLHGTNSTGLRNTWKPCKSTILCVCVWWDFQRLACESEETRWESWPCSVWVPSVDWGLETTDAKDQWSSLIAGICLTPCTAGAVLWTWWLIYLQLTCRYSGFQPSAENCTLSFTSSKTLSSVRGCATTVLWSAKHLAWDFSSCTIMWVK